MKKGLRCSRVLSFLLVLMIIIGFTVTFGEKVLADDDSATGLSYTITAGEAQIAGFTAPSGFDGTLVIPGQLGAVSVTSIAASAFKDCMSIQSITIPDSIVSIGAQAFSMCANLDTVSIKGNITGIGSGAFYVGDSNVISFVVPAGTTTAYQGLLTADVMGLTTANITEPASIAAVLDSPAAVQAASSDYISNEITWTPVTGASGYLVYRSVSIDSGFENIGETGLTAYSDGGLTTGTTYYYQIKAYTGTGPDMIESAASVTVSAMPAPAAPVNLKAVSGGYSSINLTWTAVTGATGYTVYRSTSSSSGFAYLATSAAAGYTNKNLTTGTVYYYQIRAYTLVGTTKVYSSFTSTASAKPVTAAPAGLKAVSTGYNSIKLTWTASSGASGYVVYRSTSSASGFVYAGTSASAGYTNTGLTAGTAYYYKVKAYTLVGTAKIYSEVPPVVSAAPIPAAPTNLKAVSAGYNSCNLTWTAVTGATAYSVYRSTSPSSGFAYIATAASSNCTNSGLKTGTTYYYQIKAYTLVGTTKIYSAFTSAVSGKPLLSTPSGLSVTVASSSDTKLKWNAVTGATGYKIYRSDISGGPYTELIDTTSLSYLDEYTYFGTIYYYRIKAYITIDSVKIFSFNSAAGHVTSEMIYQKGVSYFNAGAYSDCIWILGDLVDYYDYNSYISWYLTPYKDAVNYFILATVINYSDANFDGDIFNSMSIGEVRDLYESALTFSDFKNMSSYLDDPIFTGPRLEGSWSNDINSIHYYLELNIESDGSSYIYYNIPYFTGEYFKFSENGTIIQKGSDETSWKNMFRVTMVSDTEVKIYSYRDGITYTLYRT